MFEVHCTYFDFGVHIVSLGMCLKATSKALQLSSPYAG